MNRGRSTALAALAMSLAFVAPLAAQDTDVAKEGQAAAMEKSGNQEMGATSACSCSCMNMQAMHGQTMNADSAARGAGAMGGMKQGGTKGMKGDSASARGGMHAGMDPEARAAMMKAHREAMANCDCAANAKGQNAQAGMQGQGCAVNGPQGAHKMHGMKKMQGQGEDTAEEPGDSGER